MTFGEVFRFELDTKNGYVAGSKIVTLANDGAGSTVDADLLDGQHGSFYQNLANSTGTLPNARISGSYDGIDTLTANRIRVLSASDASETSTAHAIQIGPTNGLNVIMDTNEMMIRNNGARATDGWSINSSGDLGFSTTKAIQLNAPQTNFSGGLRITSGAPEIKLIDTTSGQYSARITRFR